MTSTQRGGGGFSQNVDGNVIKIGKTWKICGHRGEGGLKIDNILWTSYMYVWPLILNISQNVSDSDTGC